VAVKIRLARAGAKKKPFYKIVAADSRWKEMEGSWKNWERGIQSI